jgi:hypothetical protein
VFVCLDGWIASCIHALTFLDEVPTAHSPCSIPSVLPSTIFYSFDYHDNIMMIIIMILLDCPMGGDGLVSTTNELE